ncbi:hypothetical protein [Burkholderia vietnamiensis]|uniref:hypothetical protein n=1 Tax=Burkholderia vietnamiensis TaxID=60552 RepID=UPI00352FCF98
MADELQHEEKPVPAVPDNVFQLDLYRKKKQQEPQRARQLLEQQPEGFEVEAHLYVDICSDGATRFGVVGADEDNAICLLEPIFILGRQLVELAEN